MIYVLYVGEIDSDHTIQFIETDVTKEQVETVAKITHPDACVVAVAPRFETPSSKGMSLWCLSNVATLDGEVVRVNTACVGNLELLVLLAAEADKRNSWGETQAGTRYSEGQATLLRTGFHAAIAAAQAARTPVSTATTPPVNINSTTNAVLSRATREARVEMVRQLLTRRVPVGYMAVKLGVHESTVRAYIQRINDENNVQTQAREQREFNPVAALTDPANWGDRNGIVKLCRVLECAGRQHRAGLCATHYVLKASLSEKACAVPGCSRLYYARGHCQMHYMRMWTIAREPHRLCA